jgi:hypothetical protein
LVEINIFQKPRSLKVSPNFVAQKYGKYATFYYYGWGFGRFKKRQAQGF